MAKEDYKSGVTAVGTRDGVNVTFSTPTPQAYFPGTLAVFVNGQQYNPANIQQNGPGYSTFTIINGVKFNINKTLPANISLGYSYQNINSEKIINSDYLFINALANKQINNYFTYSYGIFIQNFTTKSELGNRYQVIKSMGWMYGPQIKIHYLKHVVLNAEYKFLMENSNYILYPSYEHQVKLLGGIILNKKFSFFLLVDFYYRRIKTNDKTTETNHFLLLPTKNRNQLSLKTVYRFNKYLSFYFKTGYFRENLFLNNFKLEGLDLLIGMEFWN